MPDLTYELEYATDLIAWHPFPGSFVPSRLPMGNGFERVIYGDIEAAIPATQGCGFVRLTVVLESGGLSAESTAPVQGWKQADLEAECEAFSYPFAPKPAFSARADAVGAAAIAVGSSAAGADLAALTWGGEYYVEILAGPMEVHRREVDEAASSVDAIAIDLGSARNTAPLALLVG